MNEQFQPWEELWTPAAAIIALRARHDLGFVHNPGGAEFTHPHYGRCQIDFMDDQEDYQKLLDWLRSKGLEPEA